MPNGPGEKVLLEPTSLARIVLVQCEIGELYLVVSAAVTAQNGGLLVNSCCKKDGRREDSGKLIYFLAAASYDKYIPVA